MTEVAIEVALPDEFRNIGKASKYRNQLIERAMQIGAWSFPFAADLVTMPNDVPIAVGVQWDIDDDPTDVHRVVAALRTEFNIEFVVIDGKLVAADAPADIH